MNNLTNPAAPSAARALYPLARPPAASGDHPVTPDGARRSTWAAPSLTLVQAGSPGLAQRTPSLLASRSPASTQGLTPSPRFGTPPRLGVQPAAIAPPLLGERALCFGEGNPASQRTQLAAAPRLGLASSTAATAGSVTPPRSPVHGPAASGDVTPPASLAHRPTASGDVTHPPLCLGVAASGMFASPPRAQVGIGTPAGAYASTLKGQIGIEPAKQPPNVKQPPLEDQIRRARHPAHFAAFSARTGLLPFKGYQLLVSALSTQDRSDFKTCHEVTGFLKEPFDITDLAEDMPRAQAFLGQWAQDAGGPMPADVRCCVALTYKRTGAFGDWDNMMHSFHAQMAKYHELGLPTPRIYSNPDAGYVLVDKLSSEGRRAVIQEINDCRDQGILIEALSDDARKLLQLVRDHVVLCMEHQIPADPQLDNYMKAPDGSWVIADPYDPNTTSHRPEHTDYHDEIEDAMMHINRQVNKICGNNPHLKEFFSDFFEEYAIWSQKRQQLTAQEGRVSPHRGLFLSPDWVTPDAPTPPQRPLPLAAMERSRFLLRGVASPATSPQAAAPPAAAAAPAAAANTGPRALSFVDSDSDD